MTRLLGFVFLQLAAALFARGRILERRREIDALRSFCEMLEQLRGLLESDGSPLPALLQTLAGRCGGQAAGFIAALNGAMDGLGQYRFQELWQRALSEKEWLPEADARQALEALGGVLGRYDLAAGLDALDVCRRQLRQRLEERQNTQAQDTRVTLGLSFSASLLLGILLL